MAQEEALLRAPPGLPSLDPAIEEGGAGPADELRRQILSELEAHVQAKMEDILKQGSQMLQKEKSIRKEQVGALSEELTECRQKQLELEAENVKLKQALTGVATRLAMYAPMYTGARESPADILSPLQPWGPSDTRSHVATPSSAAEAAAGADVVSKLAPVPAFPVFSEGGAPPTDPSAQAQPLALAEHIDAAQTPQRMPLSLSASLDGASAPPTSPPPAPNPSNGAATTFSFSLRKADGAHLGLNVSHNDSDRVLRVEGIQEGGAVEAWNKQCAVGAAEKAVLPGDQVVSVNSIAYDPPSMLEECREKQLLRLTILRPSPTPTLAAATTMRADASVFVPMGAASPPPAAAEAADTPPAPTRV